MKRLIDFAKHHGYGYAFAFALGALANHYLGSEQPKSLLPTWASYVLPFVIFCIVWAWLTLRAQR